MANIGEYACANSSVVDVDCVIITIKTVAQRVTIYVNVNVHVKVTIKSSFYRNKPENRANTMCTYF